MHVNVGNSAGQMGDNLIAAKLGSFIPESVTIGYEFTCVYSDKGVKCFGRNSYGKLGVGSEAQIGDSIDELNDNLQFTDMGTNFTPKQLTVGHEHGCVLSTLNEIKCWGKGNVGQLGLGLGILATIGDEPNEMGDNLNPLFKGCVTDNPTNIPTSNTEIPTKIPTKTPSNIPTMQTITPTYYPTTTSSLIVQISVGTEHGCALFENRDVKCWGSNQYGQLGNGQIDNIGDNETLCNIQSINFGDNFIPDKLYSEQDHNCILSINNTVKCWGNNAYGQLGYGDTLNRGLSSTHMGNNLPLINFGNNFIPKQLSLNRDHTCAISTLNDIKCWGRNDGNGNYGKLGIGNTSNILSPQFLNPIELGTNFTAKKVVTFVANTCVLSTDNEVKCFGYGESGINGQGNSNSIGDNINEMGDNLPIIDFGDNFIVKDLYGGRGHFACVVSTNNIMKCWGNCNGGWYVIILFYYVFIMFLCFY